MSNTLIANYNTANFVDNATRHVALTGSFHVLNDTAARQTPVRDSGTFKNLYAYVSANATGSTTTFTLHKVTTATALTLSYTSGQTGQKEDTSNTVSFANTDTAQYYVAGGGGGGTNTITFKAFSVQFDADTAANAISILNASVHGTTNFSTASSTRYFLPGGAQVGHSTTEANHKFRIRSSFTFSNLYTYIATNGCTNNFIFKTRKNGADGAQSVTYSTGQTGSKEDTSNSDSVVAGNDFNFATTSGAGTVSVASRTCCVRSLSTGGFFPLLNGSNAGSAVSFNTTTYAGPSGSLVTPDTTEANTQVLPRFNFTAKELGSYVSANTIATSASTITLRDNGADSAVTVSYNAAQTGLKNDSANTAIITSGTDEINYKVVTPNTSGTLTIQWIGLLGTTVDVQTAAVSPVTAAYSVPSVTATFAAVVTAAVAAVSIAFSVPSVAATYVQVETAAVSPVALTYTVPSVTADGSKYQAIVDPVVATYAAPSVTATYQAVIAAAVDPVAITYVVPSVDATYQAIVAAAVDPVTLNYAAPSVSATYAAVISASAEPVVLTYSVPSVTAQNVATAQVDPVALTYSVPSVTAVAGLETAEVDPVTLTFSVPSVSAEYDEIYSASVDPVTLSYVVPSVTASYVFAPSAVVDPLTLTYSVPEVTASYVYIAEAVVDPVQLSYVVPDLDATYVQVETAAVDPVTLSFSISEVDATYASVIAADVEPVALTYSVPEVTAQSVFSGTVEPVVLTFTVPSVTATYLTPMAMTEPYVRAIGDSSDPRARAMGNSSDPASRSAGSSSDDLAHVSGDTSETLSRAYSEGEPRKRAISVIP